MSLVASLLVLFAAACSPPPVDYVGKVCVVQDDCPSELICDLATKTCQKTASSLDAGTLPDTGMIRDAGSSSDAGDLVDGGDLVDAGDLTDGGRLRQPVTTVTAGGGALSSQNYRLQIYAGPTTPVGSVTSANYRVQLGPAPACR